VSRKLGALAEAEAALQEGEVLARKRGHRWHLSRVLCGWGRFHLETQRLEAADQSFTEALALACEVESQEREADARYGLAQVAAVRGQPEYARQQAEESLRLFEQVGFYQAVAVQQWLIQLEQGSDEVGRQPRVEVPIQWRTALPHPPLER
jgi:tetratricopeptide (TPR) repeat protein